MRAIGFKRDEPLNVEETAMPLAGPGYVLIKVAAAGLNRADLVQRRGGYAPPQGASPILGLEVSGVVERVGEGVTRWKAGDAVCALLPGGGYAEFAVAHEGSVLPVPAGVSLEEAAGVPEAVFTVWANVFEHAGLKPGESFLVHGGSSGIGTFAIQMALAHGAGPVWGTARDAAKCVLIEKLGARAINYRDQDFEAVVQEAGGVDVILDMVAGAYVQKNLRILKPGGRVVNIASLGGPKAEIDMNLVLMKHLTITGSTLRRRPVAEKARLAREVEKTVWPWIAAGKVRPLIDRIVPLEEAEAAHARMAKSDHAGKILLRM